MPAAKASVPRHEPEVVMATALRKHGGDLRRAANTSIRSLCVNGIDLTSRHGRAEELEAMADIVLALPPYLSFEVDAIHCDSKVGWAFQVTLGDWSVDLARNVAKAMESACISRIGGHGGLWVVPDPRLRIAACVDVDGRWATPAP